MPYIIQNIHHGDMQHGQGLNTTIFPREIWMTKMVFKSYHDISGVEGRGQYKLSSASRYNHNQTMVDMTAEQPI